MKRLLTLMLLLLSGCYAFAQQKGPDKHLIITIQENGSYIGSGNSLNMIVTKEDGTQEQKHLELNLHVKQKQQLAAHDALIMKILKLYYDDGWKLISSYAEVSVNRGRFQYRGNPVFPIKGRIKV